MKKEMIISVLVGLFFGLIIVYGVYTARNSLLNNPNQGQELAATPDTITDDELDDRLFVQSPDNESIVNSPLVKVTGQTDPNNHVVVFVNEDEFITQADDSGNYEIEGELELGSNIIEVIALNQAGEEVRTSVRTVIYTAEPLIEASDQEATPSASEEDES